MGPESLEKHSANHKVELTGTETTPCWQGNVSRDQDQAHFPYLHTSEVASPDARRLSDVTARIFCVPSIFDSSG
jgi:hypothetical protein